MLKRELNFVSIVKDMWREKIMCAIIIFFLVILCSSYGYYNYKKELSRHNELEAQISGEKVDGESEYVTQLRNYEEAMKANEDALRIAEEQRENIQKYIDSSILMKIDSKDVKVAYCSYVIQDSQNPSNTLYEILSYINDGGLKEDIASRRDDLETEGLKEVVTAIASGNNLFITVNHYDESKAKETLKEIQRCLDEQHNRISLVQGDYSLILSSESYYTKIDNGITSTQINNTNSLKNCVNSVADQKTKINTLQDNIENFREKKELLDKGNIGSGIKKYLVKYVFAGLIGGIILSFAILAIKSAVSDRVECADHLRYVGLPILNVFLIRKKGFTKNINITIDAIERVLSDANENNLCLYSLSEGGFNKKIYGLIEKELSEEIRTSDRLFDSKMVVAILTGKKDRYSDIDDLLEECERLNIKLLGFIVVE